MLVAGPHFRLLTLGVPMLVSAAGEVVRYRTRKHFALLIRLALEPGRKFVRDYLIDLLWPDAAPERGRHSLSQAITVLRTTVGREFVSAHRSTLALAEGVIDVDALRLETGDTVIHGPFLEGFDLRGARGFDEWREGWSARLHPQIRDCLVKHMDAARRIGDFATVERHAQVLEDINPHSEDALRGIMEARAWVGDRSNALKAFNRFVARIREDLGAEVGPDIQRMAGLLREGRRAAPRPAPDGIPPREERRFEPEAIIGREREFSALYDAWVDVRDRKPRVMVVLGDPGIGKTTLTNSFVSSCQMLGAVIARAQAYDAERELPYAVLAELVRQLTLQRAIGAAEPEALAELSRLTPDILAVFPGVPSPTVWPPEVVPLRFADAFLKAVTAAADNNPVVLVVDDIHAADNASVGILHMLARKLDGLRLMLILAGRPAELRSSTSSSALVTDSAVGELRTIQLDGFTSETGAALVARVRASSTEAPGPPPPTERILRASAGNPLAIELLTREWASHGSDAFLRQLEALDALPAPTLGIPVAVRTVFERLTRRLDARTRGILDLAAVLGRRLDNLRLYGIVGCSPGEAAFCLSELLGCGLIREVHGQLEFRNELVRAQAYYDVAESVRRELHQRVAEFLDSSEDGGPGLEIAWHFLRGGSYDRALPRALAGAEECITVGAPSEAEQLLSIFLLNGVEPSSVHRLRMLLVRAMLDQSKASQAIPHLELLSAESETELKESAEIALLRARAEQLLNRERGRFYGETATQALKVARACDDRNILVRALFESARAGTEIGDEAMLQSAYRELVAHVTEGSYAELHDAHFAVAFCEAALGYAVSADYHVRKAIEILGSAGSPTLLSRYHNGLGVISLQLCKPAEACQSFSQALQLANKIGDDSRASAIAANMCMGLTMMGKYEEALSIGNHAVDRGIRVPNQPFFVTSYSNMIDAYVLTGRIEEARSCLNAAKEWIRQERSFFARQALLVEATGFALMIGTIDDFVEAFGILERESQGRSPHFVHRAGVAKYAARRDVVMGREKEAMETLTGLANTFRRDFPFALLDTLAAKSWLEALTRGNSPTRGELLRLLDLYELHGRRATLQMEGFLDENPCAVD
ncbi:MAG TPA: AAA family ATPase [Gemmatimonadales bacterium]|nr:AAA family ATPase [Gemmatimonadales bacterium]